MHEARCEFLRKAPSQNIPPQQTNQFSNNTNNLSQYSPPTNHYPRPGQPFQQNYQTSGYNNNNNMNPRANQQGFDNYIPPLTFGAQPRPPPPPTGNQMFRPSPPFIPPQQQQLGPNNNPNIISKELLLKKKNFLLKSVSKLQEKRI